MNFQTSDEIEEITCDVLDLPAARARRIPVGFGNQNWRVESGGDEFVVKIGRAQSAPKWQAAALGVEIAREAGLPVPNLQFSGVLNGRCVRILDWIEGEPATALQGDLDRQARFGRDLGSAVALLHSVQVESFSSRLDGSAPRFDTWPDYVRHRLEQIRQRSTRNSAPEPALCLEAHDVVDAMLDSIALHCRPVVCHRDLHPDNLLVEPDGSLKAIIDWDMPEGWDAAGEWFKLNSMLFTVLPHARQPLEQQYFNVYDGEHNWGARTWLIEAIETLNVVSNAPNHSQKFTQSGIDQLRRLVTIGPPAPE